MSQTIYYLIAVVPAIVFHEVSHGWVAYLCGDDTAARAKRLTLNPLHHVDLFGTIILPISLIIAGLPPFGYAKPVPVTISKLRKPRQQSLYVSLAGPVTNIVLSGIALVVARFFLHHVHPNGTTTMLFQIIVNFGVVNICLAAFNLLPIPPFDGSAIIERFVPNAYLDRYFQIRSRALPFVFALLIINALTIHIGSNWLNDLANWWYQLI